MKKLSILSALAGLLFCGAASAADITLYYSPYCPHCHHARDFFVNKMIYEYPNLRVVQINVMDEANLPAFHAEVMDQELRDAVEVDLSDEEKKVAAENKKELEANPEDFRAKHADRQKAITEYNAAVEAAAEKIAAEKKSEKTSSIYFYVLLIALVAALGFVLVRKDKKK